MVPVKVKINDTDVVEFENVVDKNPKEITDKDKRYGGLQMTAEARLRWQLQPFEAFSKLTRTSSAKLATTIKAYLSKTFNDIRGVNIVYIPPRIIGEKDRFDVELYFSQNQLGTNSNKISSVVDITNPTNISDKRNVLYKMQKINNRISGHHFTINDDTKLLLSDMMIGRKNNNLPDSKIWNKVIEECWVPTSSMSYTRGQECVVKVSKCFDIEKILRKIYGNQMIIKTEYIKEADGTIVSKNITADSTNYEVTYHDIVPNDPNAFIMNIHQFNRKAVEDFIMNEYPIRREALSGVFYY